MSIRNLKQIFTSHNSKELCSWNHDFPVTYYSILLEDCSKRDDGKIIVDILGRAEKLIIQLKVNGPTIWIELSEIPAHRNGESIHGLNLKIESDSWPVSLVFLEFQNDN